MNTKFGILYLFMGLLASFSFVSCEEDEITGNPIEMPATVKFTSSNIGLSELAGASEITLSLDKPALKAGIIKMSYNTTYQDQFTTDPAATGGEIQIPIVKGQSTAKFTLTPADNDLHAGNLSVGFTISSVSEGFLIGSEKVLTLTIFENDQPNFVNFISAEGLVKENEAEGYTVSIGLSMQGISEGTVEVELMSDQALYGIHFTTEPEAVNGKITLPVTAGTSHLPIRFIPVDNAALTGHKKIGINISSASGGVTKGDKLAHAITLIDDELIGKPKGYETGAGTWRVKRTFEYNESGAVSRVIWEQNSLNGIDTYHYNETGQLTKISDTHHSETLYLRDDQERIVRSEKYDAGVLKKYMIYSYDNGGNVGEVAVFNRQPSGEFIMSSLFVYLYYSTSNNLYKRLTYYPLPESEDFALIQEEMYEYADQNDLENPFPMVEILPGLNAQPSFPSRYLLSRDGQEYNYQLNYTFNNQGLPVKRTVSNGTAEVTTYEYY